MANEQNLLDDTGQLWNHVPYAYCEEPMCTDAARWFKTDGFANTDYTKGRCERHKPTITPKKVRYQQWKFEGKPAELRKQLDTMCTSTGSGVHEPDPANPNQCWGCKVRL